MTRPECQDIANDLQDARNELAIAQHDWLEEPRNSANKARLRREVVRLQNLAHDLERSLRDCEGLPQFPQPIRALFTCRVFVITSASIFTPTNPSNIQASMIFSDIDYRRVEFSFPDTPVGTSTGGIPPLTVTNTISARTVPAVAYGAFERTTGHIDMASAGFEVRQSLDFADNGSVNFMPLTTRTVPSPIAGILTGMPLDRSATPGRVILVGSSVLSGAVFFGGTSIDLIIDGVLSAFPPV
jgi:hypothetical protein